MFRAEHLADGGAEPPCFGSGASVLSVLMPWSRHLVISSGTTETQRAAG